MLVTTYLLGSSDNSNIRYLEQFLFPFRVRDREETIAYDRCDESNDNSIEEE